MAAPFDPSMYVRAPVITVSSGVALAKALSEACPKDATPGVKKALKHLVALAGKAQTDLADRNRALGAFTDEDSRDLDNQADRAWGGLRLRLAGLTMLPAADHPRARRAAELDAQLFAEGTEFLKLDYAAQSTAMSALLERIVTDGLQKEIDDLAGSEFLKAIKSVQPRYEAMVSERLRRDKAMGQNLLEATRGLQEAIVNYAAKVIGTIEHDDPSTAEAARLALLPIANLRDAFSARQARAAVGAGGEDAAGDATDGEDAGAGTEAGTGEGAAPAGKSGGKKQKPG